MSHPFWSLLAVLSLWGWIIATLLFIFRAFPRRGFFDGRSARLWGVLVVACFSLWVLGLLKV